MKTGLLTDRGMRRIKNEDYVKVINDINLYLLADGVGGNRSGEIASKETVETFAKYVKLRYKDLEDDNELIKLLEDSIIFVNNKIYNLANSKEEYLGMATTFVYVLVKGNLAYVGNVGDSRAYLIHEEKIIQITDDHTYVNELVKAGMITSKEARNHTKKNVITRAIGAEEKVIMDLYTLPMSVGDVIVLCSDGLYDELTDKKIYKIIKEKKDMQKCAESLVENANDHGGNDNVSVICIKIMEDN
ncbi:MAG TPA: Stp1/IreP family PP2C-type Ser/Thr phosphatase [Anaerovoracaceae bacterium]|nr:Stp1/IreP family PP2C-type Ser/Thr phosphatase [Anaerovoracaceae bacterium]